MITIQIIYLIVCILEAWLEQAVIKLKSESVRDYDYWDKKEHSRSAVYACTVAGGLIFLSDVSDIDVGKITEWLWLVGLFLVMLLIRRVFFDFPLKSFRNIRYHQITGNGPVDTLVRMIFGKNGGWIELLTWLALIVVFNLLKFRTQ